MKQLPNNCRLGKISIFPKNWDKSNAKTNFYWRISYWFYDDTLKQKKQIPLQGMNHLSDLVGRQNTTRSILENEQNLLEKKGYNPITGKFFEPELTTGLPTDKTGFIKALKMAFKNISASSSTMRDLEDVINHIEIGAKCLDLEFEPIYEIKKRHVRSIFDFLTKKYTWSNYNYNKYRSYLMILFSELSEYDAVESNIPRELKKKKSVKRARITLTSDERTKVKEYLQEQSPRFLLFVNMFFHSGARITEFFRIRIKDINLERQQLKITVMKGRQYVEVIKPIKNIALPYWEEYLKGFTDNNLYLMGKGLYPSAQNIRYDQINKRWLKIKKKLGIEADFYALKHLNSEEVSEQVGIERAQKLNSHTSVDMTKIYAFGEKAREIEIIKRVANEF